MVISSEELRKHAKLFFLEFKDPRFNLSTIESKALLYVKKNDDFKYKDVVNSSILIDLLSNDYGYIEKDKNNVHYILTQKGLDYLK
ncbi:hypothetical protein Celal_1452 [Cellulophaga algicola DSM 14237]|uniref:Uncharacterized protein n=1 Tax=Cellulophaga algicola (strain DSM 14237 / IC166 / ACAM 630) TaxID=688270 RepID=E6X9L4_CELAD|nr:hypothetical protein [Cellulophaga algicola]ADV48764.1 hypothetical protein Celal_1452 [Cellulophaga algicola DSM 14237]